MILNFRLFYKLIFICIVIISDAYPQPKDIKFEHITINDGLSQNTVNCIFQDRRGFLWFGTQDGLNRYDGYNFDIFKQHPLDSNTISHNWIWDIFEDRNGNIWIATWRGLNKYEPESTRFIRYFPTDNNQYSISNSRPTSLKEDQNGNIFIATWGGGLNCFVPDLNQFFSYQKNPQDSCSLCNNFVRAIFIDSRHFIWIGTWGGLCRIKSDSLISGINNEFKSFLYNFNDPLSISGNKIVSIHEDKFGWIWVGTMENGLNRFDYTTGEFTRFKHDPKKSLSISSDKISAIYEDSFGNVWIGSQDEGINLYNPESNGFVHYKSNDDAKSTLSSNMINVLYEDKSGMLWIGTSINGLNKLNLNRKKFNCFVHSKTQKNSISGNLVRSFYEDKSGMLWIGTKKNGLNRYNPETGQFKHFRHDPDNPYSISSNDVQTITGSEPGVLWIGTFDGGLNQYDPKLNRFFHYKNDPDDKGSVSSNNIEILKLDSKGYLWIGTADKGLDRYDIKSKQFEHFTFNVNDSNSLSTNYILSLYEDSQGRIWIGGWGGGLNLYDSEKMRFIRFYHDPSNPNSICDDIVNSIYETQHNGKSTLWVATSGGLSYMSLHNPLSGEFNHYFERDGLPNQHIYGILEDVKGNLWFSTNKGLSKFTSPDYFKNYDASDGLSSSEFSGGAYYRATDGQLYFGCSEGFIAFYPDSIKDNFHIPPVAITSFQKFNKSVKTKKNISTIRAHTLSYDENVFSFEFSALDFTAPDKNQYAYKMEGFNNDWIFADAKRRIATFTNLNPGEYMFRVKGSNNDGIWNEQGTSVKIIITPPWWQRWWFRMLSVLLISGLIIFIYKKRIDFLKKEKVLQEEFSKNIMESREKERKRIAGELHDSLGQDLLIVSNELKQYIMHPDNEIDDLKHASQTMAEAINEVREIAYNLHPHQLDRLGLTKAIKSVVSKISRVSDIHFILDMDEIDNKLPEEQEIHFYRIIQEALNNIIKHSMAKNVWVKIRKGDGLNVTIKDNGTGFDQTKKSGLGLVEMNERVKMINGTLEIFSKKGTGTEIKIDIKDKYTGKDERNTPCATEFG